MFGSAKPPFDPTPYPQDPASRPIRIGESVGRYAFVVDTAGVVHIVPDAPHVHPKVLGLAREALYAGEIAIDRPGHVEELTNLSGTFQFRSKTSLCCVATVLRSLGFVVAEVVWYPPSGATGPVRLQCP